MDLEHAKRITAAPPSVSMVRANYLLPRICRFDSEISIEHFPITVL
jgi:hypothetical protein